MRMGYMVEEWYGCQGKLVMLCVDGKWWLFKDSSGGERDREQTMRLKSVSFSHTAFHLEPITITLHIDCHENI